MSANGTLGVTISFYSRPRSEPSLTDSEENTIVRHLNKTVTWGKFRAVSLNYFGSPDVASIYITLAYRKSLRNGLEILQIGNPNVLLADG